MTRYSKDMRKIIAGMIISLDGLIPVSDDELNWLQTQEEEWYSGEFLSRFDTIFYGRIAYEKSGMGNHDILAIPEASRSFYHTMNSMRKYVFSKSVKHVPGNGMVVYDNLLAEVKRIRDEEGKDIWLYGGADIFMTFIELDLIDEYLLFVQPRLSEKNKPLSKKRMKSLNLRFIKTQNLGSGVVVLHYQSENRFLNN